MIEDCDIINSVQVPQLVKDKFLQNGILEKDLRDRPIHYSGGFAIVFVFNVEWEKWAFFIWGKQPGKKNCPRLGTMFKIISQINIPNILSFTFFSDRKKA